MRRRRSLSGLQNLIKPPKYFLEVAKLIADLYPDAEKIVEIGIGLAPWALLNLKKLLPKTTLLAVDVDEVSVMKLRKLGLNVEVDDVLNPRIELYQKSNLIYSIRPPMELIDSILRIAEKVRADVLVFPLSEDSYLFEFRPPWSRVDHPSLLAFILKHG
ncbi:MAG: hypothetical protein DRN49_02490 [Thaumarchaeota archaeon]|nr:MAG: hypothetical protein DRN49_02490 [Nitrososphaerota archaeon]